ncbi:MAG: alpha-D-ribose 1-methylphosphonate 5-triphosphate diphosphatase [Alphaproteobacteria bacterium]|nr:alpha-D-ribose 1-methylphosphonate 5-triphosphate diphosphatase [Alphaproteobacteria bacterium]
MMAGLTVTNARIVTRDDIVSGTVEVAGGRFSAVGEGSVGSGAALDFEGDYLLPGLVELHTDNLERQFTPRPGVEWPAQAAVLAHDSQLAAAGITTALDTVRIGGGDNARPKHLSGMADAVKAAMRWGVLRAEHFLHLRCEVSSPGLMERFRPFMDDPLVRLVSLMDHTPGQRQFVDLAKHREYYQGRYGLNDDEMDDYVKTKQQAQQQYSDRHRSMVVKALSGRNIALASHDDATVEHVEESVRDGVAIAEFPTTAEAAEAARRNGLAVLMGAPNLVLGGSHSGNASALDLAVSGLLDMLSSDYVPSSTLQGVFLLRDGIPDMTLPRAARVATANPARAVGLEDRGEIAEGKRADFIRVREVEGVAVVRSTWREGLRVI